MKIAVLGTSRSGVEPRTIRLVTSLAAVGHEVVFVSPGHVDDRIDASVAQVVTIDTRWPRAGGTIAGPLRRRNPKRLRISNMRRRAMAILTSLQPDLVYVADRELVRLVDDRGFTIASDMKTKQGIVNNLADLAPQRPMIAGLADSGITPWVQRQPSNPIAGRHRGRRIVLCYHPTDTTPARYLHAALERAGVVVDHRYPDVDLSDVDPETDGVVFVESPYPAMDVTGGTPVPVVYWVHHGEIHLYQNIRLAQRYQADGVLLAHSWHLAHRFSSPVYRFPFGVPTEMLAGIVPFGERNLDVSMIAAGFDDAGGRYATRREVAKVLTEDFGSERVLFRGGLSPKEMFDVYARSKAVIDEGGSLHRPITMRIFEATGSGAALVTEPAPGIELLYEPVSEFMTLDAIDPVSSLRADRDLSETAAAGNIRALGIHTYDHRVDELFSILERLVPPSEGNVPLSSAAQGSCDEEGSGVPLSSGTNEESSDRPPFKGDRRGACDDAGGFKRGTSAGGGSAEPSGVRRSSSLDRARGPADPPGSKTRQSPLKGGRLDEADFLAAVERYAEIDSVACSDQGSAWFASSSYLVWGHGEAVNKEVTVDAVVLDDDSVVTVQLLERAHRFVFSSGSQAPTVASMLTQSGRTFVESTDADVHIFDFETPGYIVRDTP